MAGPKHLQIIRLVLLRHQLGKPARQVELVADDLRGLEADDPGVDRSCERMTFAIDDVAPLGRQVDRAALATGMVSKSGEPDQSQRNDRDDSAKEQHSEHQALMHQRQDLPPLPDQTEPLGPCDESGRRGVHLVGIAILESAFWEFPPRRTPSARRLWPWAWQ